MRTVVMLVAIAIPWAIAAFFVHAYFAAWKRYLDTIDRLLRDMDSLPHGPKWDAKISAAQALLKHDPFEYPRWVRRQ